MLVNLLIPLLPESHQRTASFTFLAKMFIIQVYHCQLTFFWQYLIQIQSQKPHFWEKRFALFLCYFQINTHFMSISTIFSFVRPFLLVIYYKSPNFIQFYASIFSQKFHCKLITSCKSSHCESIVISNTWWDLKWYSRMLHQPAQGNIRVIFSIPIKKLLRKYDIIM